MADEFEHPRLAGVYDAFEADRADLAAYLDLATEPRSTPGLSLIHI